MAKNIAKKNKIEQPRVNGGQPPQLATKNGLIHWVNYESEIEWHKEF